MAASPGDGVHLLTGATGFIGAHLAARLASEGRKVRCLVRAGSDTSRLPLAEVELARGDLTDPRSLAPAVEGCQYVLHCGALVSDWATTQEITEANVIGTRNLLQACAVAPVRRFVHFSTTDVYSHPGTPATDESYQATSFGNWYAHTKRAAEQEVRRAEATHSLQAVILRPATVYGPGSRDVIGEIAQAIATRKMLLIARGRAIAGLCYVENLIDAALLALGNGAAPGEAFNISDGLSITWRQFVDDLADGLGYPRVRLSIPYPPAFALGYLLEHGYRLLRRTLRVESPALLSRQAVQVLGVNQDFSSHRARTVLGWAPRVDYVSALAATLAWLRDGRGVRS